jgi:glycosyltransferase involved in cell wall biosynthesis
MQFQLNSQYRTYIPELLRRVLSKLVLGLLKFVDKKAIGIISATKTIQSTYSNENSIVIGNEAKVEEFKEAKPRFQNSKVLFLGSTSDIHCFNEIVDAMTKFENLELMVAGTSIDEQSMARSKHLLSNRVDFKGWVNRGELLTLISQSVVGMVTYQNIPTYMDSEAQPTKLFEFLMSGLPVIATPIKSSLNYLKSSGGGIICEGFRAIDIEKALKEATGSESLWIKMSTDGKLWATENAGWNKSEKRLITFYSEIVSI